jgi:hypothetical protein
MHRRSVPSGFGTSTTGAAHRLSHSSTIPISINSSISLFKKSFFCGIKRQGGTETGALVTVSIECSASGGDGPEFSKRSLYLPRRSLHAALSFSRKPVPSCSLRCRVANSNGTDVCCSSGRVGTGDNSAVAWTESAHIYSTESGAR